MMILETNNNKLLENQAYFDDFNWPIFETGEVVWLEDYTGNDLAGRAIAAVLNRREGERIFLTIMTDFRGRQLVDAGVTNISEMPGDFWEIFTRCLEA